MNQAPRFSPLAYSAVEEAQRRRSKPTMRQGGAAVGRALNPPPSAFFPFFSLRRRARPWAPTGTGAWACSVRTGSRGGPPPPRGAPPQPSGLRRGRRRCRAAVFPRGRGHTCAPRPRAGAAAWAGSRSGAGAAPWPAACRTTAPRPPGQCHRRNGGRGAEGGESFSFLDKRGIGEGGRRGGGLKTRRIKGREGP